MGDRAEKRDGDEVASLQLFTAERVLHSRVRQQVAGVAQHAEPLQAQWLQAQLFLQPQPQPSCWHLEAQHSFQGRCNLLGVPGEASPVRMMLGPEP